MKRIFRIVTISILYLYAGIALAQQPAPSQQQAQPPATGQQPVAGRATVGVTVIEMEAVIAGWSVKKDLLGKTVINDQKDKIGKIDDIIVTPDNSVSYAIIGVGGFLGIGKNDVAVPMKQIKLQSGNLILPGATKEALKALPKFEYARK